MKNITSRTPDRTSNGRVIRGSARPEAELKEREACYGKECAYLNPSRMENLFREVTSRIGKVMTKGRPMESLSAAEKSVVKAFENVKLLDPMKNDECRKHCRKKGSGRQMEAGICMCPWMEVVSDEVLIFVMAHELSHRGDICSSKETGLKAGQHPFEINNGGGSVLECLQTGGIAGRAVDENKTFAKKTIQASAQVLSNILPIDDKSVVGKTLGAAFSPVTLALSPGQLSAHCRGPLGHSQMQEASADVFGFEVQADFLKDFPLKRGDASNPRRVFGFLLLEGCEPSGDLVDPGFDSHADDLHRISKIALSLPSMREALGCTDHSANLSCDYRPTAVAAPTPGVAPAAR